jgi:carbamoyltransferase
LWEIRYPPSLGLLYSAFTHYIGFKVNSGEHKLMGLAPYGQPRYVGLIREHLLDLNDDGGFRLNMDYFEHGSGLTMTNSRFDELFGGPPRQAESPSTQRQMDIAASIQAVTEEVVLRLARSLHKQTGEAYLCLAGGVALNCVANGRLLREGPYKDVWIQPAAADAGGALGAALIGTHIHAALPRKVLSGDAMQGAFLGPGFTRDEIRAELNGLGAHYTEVADEDLLCDQVAEILDDGNVVGWRQGRLEFGPRSLGGSSILGDPRSDRMQSVMNLKIKYRESFRPFAPSVLAERAGDYFELDRPSPYMLFVAPLKGEHRIALSGEEQSLVGLDKVNARRSILPAITHVDYSARVQTVHRETTPRYHKLLKAFEKRTGCGVLVNTSFNMRGEPLVCTPGDAYRCFMRTGMDALVLDGFLLRKKDQPVRANDVSWMHTFEPD